MVDRDYWMDVSDVSDEVVLGYRKDSTYFDYPLLRCKCGVEFSDESVPAYRGDPWKCPVCGICLYVKQGRSEKPRVVSVRSVYCLNKA